MRAAAAGCPAPEALHPLEEAPAALPAPKPRKANAPPTRTVPPQEGVLEIQNAEEDLAGILLELESEDG